jgi:protein SCO1/2
LFFGYTHCPDVCPVTLSELNRVAKRLSGETTTAPPQYVFVTVDPKRDIQEHLAGYVSYFNDNFIGLTGEMKDIDQLAKQLKIKHSIEKNTVDNSGNYIVNHSSSILLIDPQGRYFAKFSAPHYAESIHSNFLLIQQLRKGKT